MRGTRSNFHLEKCGFALRNINNVTFSYAAETDFDSLMSKQEQDRWLNDVEFIDLEGDRILKTKISESYASKYEKLKTLPMSTEIISVVREYVRIGIPAIKRSETTFWNCSCLRSNTLYVRINVGGQTTFDAYLIENKPSFTWYLTRALAEDVLGTSLKRLRKDYGNIFIFDDYPEMEITVRNSDLTKGGTDQVFIDVEGLENAKVWIRDTYMKQAVRIFNLGLVQKGPCLWGKNHCFELADRLVE